MNFVCFSSYDGSNEQFDQPTAMTTLEAITYLENTEQFFAQLDKSLKDKLLREHFDAKFSSFDGLSFQ